MRGGGRKKRVKKRRKALKAAKKQKDKGPADKKICLKGRQNSSNGGGFACQNYLQQNTGKMSKHQRRDGEPLKSDGKGEGELQRNEEGGKKRQALPTHLDLCK